MSLPIACDSTMSMTPHDAGTSNIAFDRIAGDGSISPIERAVPIERAIAIEFDGIGYAVMMATPTDLDDFATGFAFTERLIGGADGIVAIDHHPTDHGIILRVTLGAERSGTLLERVRHRTSDSSCGLCGIESLEQALRPLPRVPMAPAVASAAIFRALAALRERQPLNRATGAVHAAARCSADGTILEVREDVGRHNAFDKLIGAMLRSGAGRTDGWAGGFALLSSRCSFELVEKATLAGCPTLVTVSAATDLAIARARSCGLTLVPLARADAILRVPPG